MRSFILYLFLLLVMLPSTNAAEMERHAILDLAQAFDANELPVSEWNVTIKEQITHDDAMDIIDKLSTQFDVQKTKDEGSKKYQVSDTHKTTKSDVQYIVVLPNSAHYKAELIVSINGHNWNDSIEKAYINQVEALKNGFFSERSKTFACLTAGFRGTISSVYLIDKLKEGFQANIMSKQTDSIEKSMINEIYYGYTPLWEDKITINKTPTNLQFVIKRTTNDRLKLTVGTPILINEY